MTTADRLRALAAALPSDASAVTLTRADLVALLEDVPQSTSLPTSDLTVEQVAAEVGRAPSTVRGWLIARALDGYKLRGRDWRVPRAALRAFLALQAAPAVPDDGRPVDITAWRRVAGVKSS